MKRILFTTLLLISRSTGFAQTRVTAQAWEPQARQLAIDATSDSTISIPSGVEPAPAQGDPLLLDLRTATASGWRYDYAYGDFNEGGSRRVVTVSLVSDQVPEVVVPEVWSSPSFADNLYPLQTEWVDSDVFLELAASVDLEGWNLDGFQAAYPDAAVAALRAYGGSQGPQNGFVGLWTIEVKSEACGVWMSVRYWADGSHEAGGGRLADIPMGYCFSSVASEDAPVAPSSSLDANVPNPFSHATNILFSVSRPSSVRIDVLDMLGRVVTVVGDGYFRAGTHTVTWKADGYPAGVYMYRMLVNGAQHVRLMTLVQ